MSKLGDTFSEIVDTIKKLREPDGCPWDREQTLESALKDLEDEIQEAKEALGKKDWEELQEELGDVLWSLIFTANIAREEGKLDIDTMLANLKEKIVRRHPHVFGEEKHKNMKDHYKKYEEIKQEEKRQKNLRAKMQNS